MAPAGSGRRSTRRVQSAQHRRRLIAVLAVCLSVFGLGGLQASSSPLTDPEVEVEVSLRVSDSPDRSESVPLDGAVVGGEQYIFVPKVAGIRAVVFYAGEPSASTKLKSEGGYPYDLAGGTTAQADPIDITELGSGETTLTAIAYFRNGERQEVTARFRVEPRQPIAPSPTSSPTTESHGPTVKPTTTPTTTPTPTPSRSPEPEPTTSPEPEPPSESPEPEPDPNPEPEPEPDPPSGYPTEDTTGVPAGTTLKTVEGMTVTQAGQVLEGLDIRGCLRIDADNVTVRNSRVQCAAGSGAVIKIGSGTSGALIENVEIDGQGASSNGVASGGFTLRRVNIHSTSDGVRAGSNTVIEHSYIHHLLRIGDSHSDAIQSVGGRNITIRYNNIQAYNSTTRDPMNAAFIFAPDLSPLANVEVYGNLLNGGNYTIFGAKAENAVVRDNAFGRNFRYGPVRLDGTIGFDSSNHWHDNGKSVQ